MAINYSLNLLANLCKKFTEKAAIMMLVEGESKRKYNRKRLAQSFTAPDQLPSKRPKKHSPNFNNVQWDKENLEQLT